MHWQDNAFDPFEARRRRNRRAQRFRRSRAPRPCVGGWRDPATWRWRLGRAGRVPVFGRVGPLRRHVARRALCAMAGRSVTRGLDAIRGARGAKLIGGTGPATAVPLAQAVAAPHGGAGRPARSAAVAAPHHRGVARVAPRDIPRGLATNNRGFLEWVLRKDFSEKVKAIVRDALAGQFPVRSETEAE